MQYSCKTARLLQVRSMQNGLNIDHDAVWSLVKLHSSYHYHYRAIVKKGVQKVHVSCGVPVHNASYDKIGRDKDEGMSPLRSVLN
jgi:hypothetical protein